MSITDEFTQFRASHPIVRRTVSGHDWSYIASGSGASTIVILPGGGGDADSMFPVVVALERQHRVIAIGYSPTVTTVTAVVEGVRAILESCGVGRCGLLGHSLGGMVALALAQAYPQRVDTLVIANCAVYTPGRARLLKIALPVALALPTPVLKGWIRSAFNRLLKCLPAQDRQFWRSYVNQCTIMEPGSKGLRGQLRCLLDFVRHPPCRSASSAWHGRILLLESERETGFTPRERAQLRSCFPEAAVHLFSGAGHLSFITHRREFVETAGRFLAGN